MKKMMLLMLTLLIWGAASMNAQVRIGGETGPDKSAVLDLNKTDDPAPAGNLGLSLPRINLQTVDQRLATGETPKNGTVVYNTSDKLDGQGVYVWTDGAWVRVAGASVATPVITEQPKAFSFSRLIDANGDPDGPTTATIAKLKVEADNATSHQWYQKANNLNAPAIKLTGNGATTKEYTPVVDTWGMKSYYCVVKNATNDSVISNVAEVAIGCGAKTVTGGWLSFMCYNQGATPNNKPFEFAQETLGALYQWGQPLPFRSDVLEKTPWVSVSKYPYDWRIPNGYDTPLTDTYRQNDDARGLTGSCPEGWIVPSIEMYKAMYSGINKTGFLNDSYANSWRYTGAPSTGGYAVMPDGATTTLYFPAVGAVTSFTNFNQSNYTGIRGWYHTSTLAGVFTTAFYYNTNYIVFDGGSGRYTGAAVRCVLDN